MKIRVAGIVKDSIVDGPGLRLAIFAQGCSHECEGCHNPQTWDYNSGQLVDVDILKQEIKKQKLIDGITLTGGEPFEQAEGFAELAKEGKKMGLTVVTFSGYTFEEIMNIGRDNPSWKELLQNTDLLVDGPFKIAEKDLSLAYRGSRNQRIIKVPETLVSGELVLY